MYCFNVIPINCVIPPFKVIIANELYLKALFSLNKSLNKLLMLLFPKNNELSKLLLSITSAS